MAEAEAAAVAAAEAAVEQAAVLAAVAAAVAAAEAAVAAPAAMAAAVAAAVVAEDKTPQHEAYDHKLVWPHTCQTFANGPSRILGPYLFFPNLCYNIFIRRQKTSLLVFFREYILLRISPYSPFNN